MTDRDRARLVGVSPDLIIYTGRILAAMDALGFPMMVTDGVRTVAAQQALYAQGRTAVGLIVTQRDGVTRRSNHQTHADGFGHAVDCCFLVDGQPSWDHRLPWHLYGAMAQALGLVWGGAWTKFVDLPHIELSEDVIGVPV